MVIHRFWNNCDCGGAVWGEVTEAEVTSEVFPRLSDDAVAESKRFAKRTGHPATRPDRTCCVLVVTDRSCLRPFEVHSPFHQ